MKVKYVKFSDERRREFCIKTVIGKDSGIWTVSYTHLDVYKRQFKDRPYDSPMVWGSRDKFNRILDEYK